MQSAVVIQNIALLCQAQDLLSNLDESVYSDPAADGSSAGVGPHLRHCLDFYRCFEFGWPTGRIDYDERARGVDIETRIDRARGEVDRIRGVLEGLVEEDRTLLVRADVAEGEDPDLAWSRSTLHRELRFLVSHTVHHFALIAMVLRSHGLEPAPGFGIAPSTLSYWSQATECAQ